MNKLIIKLALKFLDELAERYSNDGCNDMFLDELLLTDEEIEDVKRLLRWHNSDPEITLDSNIVSNSDVLDIVMKRLQVALLSAPVS